MRKSFSRDYLDSKFSRSQLRVRDEASSKARKFAARAAAAGGAGEYSVSVKDGILCDCCGSTTAFSHKSSVYYDPSITVRVDRYAQVLGISDRPAWITALGRGIGNTAAHELLHQLFNTDADNHLDQSSFDYHGCDRPEQFFGPDLHWTPNAFAMLKGRLPYSN